MKLSLVFFNILFVYISFLVASDSSYYAQGDNEHIWMLDEHGIPYIVDVDLPVIQSPMNFSGADNEYWLYTRRNPNNSQVIVHGDANTVWYSNYNPDKALMVIIHGWNNDGNSPMNALITSAFLSTQDANVIVVDWRTISQSEYPTASEGVLSVGQYLGNFLVWLMDITDGNWDHVHLVGFSLGAHVAGIAGRHGGGKSARVTGLDPAGPLWSGNSNALSRESGQYVESIHTDGGTFGTYDHNSHSDFYPNGGTNPQPGCLVSVCSHGRSTELFASSIRFNHLIGRLCLDVEEAKSSNCSGSAFNMGNSIFSKRGKGLYALHTNDTWPF